MRAPSSPRRSSASPVLSADGQALLVGLGLDDEAQTEAVIEEVREADALASYSVAIAGDETLDHDFNLLSQEDLEKGELQFGLPAALIILLLVFGAVVAGLDPAPDGDRLDRRRARARARSSPSSSSSRSSS